MNKFVYIICVIVHIIYSIIYMPIFVDLAIFREVDGIHLLAILKNTTINLDLQNALQAHRFSILLGTNSEVQLLTHMVIIFLNRKKKIAMLFPTAAACIVLHSNLQYKRIPISLHSWCLLFSFVFVLCEVAFHWGSDLHSCMFNHVESFVLFINYLLVFSEDMVIQVLQSVLN